MATGISYKNIIGGIQWPISETPPLYKRKNLAKISYTTRVIANSVPNFVAFSTGVGRGKCNWQHSMAHLQNPFMGAKISAESFTEAE